MESSPRHGKTEWSALENRRESEVMRYAELLGSLGLLHSPDGPKTSKDSALTAYAQLVALRLNGKRVIISLVGREHQYMLTEATRTLSLQNDTVHEPGDSIRWGMAILPLASSLCRFTMQSDQPGPLGRCGKTVIIPDLKLDATCSQHPTVTSQPFSRSLASVPLLTTGHIAIGALTLLDNKPRYDLCETDTMFMRDVAATVMAHLDMRCAYYAHERALRMTRGLGQLVSSKHVENCGSVLGWSSPSITRDDHTSMPHRADAGLMCLSDESLPQSIQPKSLDTTLTDERAQQNSDSNETADRELLPSSRRSMSPDKVNVVESSVAPAHAPLSDRLDDIQEVLLAPGVEQTFERAATILQNGMDVTGVLFLDAPMERLSSRGIAADGLTTSASESSGKSSDVSEESGSAKSAFRASKGSGRPSSKRRKSCNVLGFAIKNGPIGNVQESRAPKRVTEFFLDALVRRFPCGKVWNFGEDSSSSSDAQSESSCAMEATPGRSLLDSTAQSEDRTYSREKRRPRTTSAKLQQIFPGVKSVALMPLWDSHRERNFAASLVWSCDPLRNLSFQDDVPFLAAFSDVIMAEVARLDAQMESRSKTKFISSVSHELRSPLHGIIGATEVLQNRESVALHDEMLQMIQGCSKSLMDIIDHLLDHAQTLFSATPSKQEESETSDRGAIEAFSKHSFGQNNTKECCDISVITQEVMDACLWSMPKSTAEYRSETDGYHSQSTNAEPLHVTLELRPSGLEHDWNFNISAGAWRRLVLNLVSNSIKYTDPGGYLKVTVSAQNMPSRPQPINRELVQLECVDNGRGMSQEYLNNGLWKAFSQEDGHAQGTGLGLSLVRGIVTELGGDLEAQSRKGIGTKITVSLPLTRTERRHSSTSLEMSLQQEQVLQGNTVALLGFDADHAQDERAVESMQVLRASVVDTCRNLGLTHVEDSPDADFYLLTEQAARSTTGLTKRLADRHLGAKIVVLCQSAAAAHHLTISNKTQFANAIFVSQPVGPQKLQRCFVSSLEKRRDSVQTPIEDRSSPEPSLSSINARSPPTRRRNEAPRLPLHGSSPLSSSKQLASTRPSCSVLLVEDNEINLRLLQAYMKKSGHHHISATNGLDALNVYKTAFRIADEARLLGGVANSPPSIILMDINMPVMDGFESTRRIRAFERTSKIETALIVALTALSSHDARQRAHICGVDYFLTKPVKMDELRHLLDLRTPTPMQSNHEVIEPA